MGSAKTPPYFFSLVLKRFRVYIKLTEVEAATTSWAGRGHTSSSAPTGFTCDLLTFLSGILKSTWPPSFFWQLLVCVRLVRVFLFFEFCLFGSWIVVSSLLIFFHSLAGLDPHRLQLLVYWLCFVCLHLGPAHFSCIFLQKLRQRNLYLPTWQQLKLLSIPIKPDSL